MLLCTVLALGLLPRRRAVAVAGDHAAVAEEPALAPPWQPSGRLPSRAARILAPLGAAVVAAALVNPIVGLVVGALVLAAVHRPQWRTLLALGAPAALGLAGLYVFVQQFRHDYPPVFEWPTFFDRVHTLGWVAIVFLVADAVVERLRAPTGDARDGG
jgi:hypothetical protein